MRTAFTKSDWKKGAPLVAKFYRPGRWTDAAILEEHAFVQELAEREIPVVPALVLDGITLHSFEGFRFAVFPKRGGRAPELEDRHTLEWIGRFLGRIHAIGALKPFRERPALDIASFGEQPRDYLLAHKFIPADLDAAYRSAVNQALDGVRHCFARAGEVRALRLHGDCHAGNVLWTTTVRTSSISTTAAWARRCRTCGCYCRANAPTWCGNWPTCWPATRILRFRRARIASGRGAAHPAPDPLLRHGWRGAGTIRPSRRRSRGSIPSAIGRTASWNCANRSR